MTQADEQATQAETDPGQCTWRHTASPPARESFSEVHVLAPLVPR